MALDSDSLLLLHVAPWSFSPEGRQDMGWVVATSMARRRGGDPQSSCGPHSPVTPKLQASRVALWEVVTLTSRQSSSRDQLLAWATYCLVAVM